MARADAESKVLMNPTGRKFEHCPVSVTSYIERRISDARRHWPSIPSRFAVLGHLVEGACALLLVVDLADGRSLRWILQGVGAGGAVNFFGIRLAGDQMSAYEFGERMGLLQTYLLPLDRVVLSGERVRVFGNEIIASGDFHDFREVTAT